MPGQAFDAGAFEQVAGVVEGAVEALLAALVDEQPQVELGAMAIVRQARQAQAWQLFLQGNVMALQAEQHLEQRVVAEAAFRLQCLHQLLEGQVLVRLSGQHRVAHLLQQAVEGLGRVQPRAQYLGVDEQSDQPFALAALTVGHWHPDAEVVLAAVALQEHIEGGEQQHERRCLACLGQAHQTRRQLRRQRQSEALSAVALLRRARVIGGQFEDARGIAELLLPIGELALALPAGQPVPLPQGVVGVLDRQLRQRSAAGLALSCVKLAQFADQDVHGPAIADHVMQGQQQVMAIILQTQQADAQQRPVDQVERRSSLGSAQGVGLTIRIGLGAQVAEGQGEAARRQDALPHLAILAGEAGAQGLVARQQAGEGPLQRQAVQRAIQAQRHRHVVGIAGRVQLPEEPHALLRKRQRQARRTLPAHRARVLFIGTALEGLGQAGHVRRVKQRPQRQFDAERLAHPRNDAYRQQRMATHFEEIVVAADPLDAQHFRPDRRQAFFLLATRRAVAACLPVRRRQRLAIELAVGAQRHAVEVEQLGRDHVVRQLSAQAFAQFVQQRLRVRHRGIRGDVAHQLGTALPLPGNHHGFANARMFQQSRLDLSEFDTQATQLDLMVDAADVVDHAIGAPARQVAGAVHAIARGAEGVGDEALGGQAWTAQVTTRQVDSGDVQFAGNAHRHRLQLAVEDHQAGVGDGATDGHRVPARLVDALPVADVDGRLGRTIEVVQPGAVLRLELLLQLVGQCLAAAHHLAQAGAGRQLAGGDEGLQHGGYEVQGGDALPDYGLAQARRVAVGTRLGHHQRRAAEPGPEELPDRHVEAEWRLLQDAVAAVQAVLLLHPLQAVEQAGVVVAHALGPAGGAGGIDAVGKAVRRVIDGRRLFRLAVGLRPVAVQAPDRRVARRQAIEQGFLGEQQRYATVFQHEGQAVGRVIRIQRQVGAASLDDGEQRDGQLRRSLGEHPDPHITTHALAAQPMGQAVGPRLQLRIGEAALAVHQGAGLGRACGLAADQLGEHRQLAVILQGGVPACQQLLALLDGQQRQSVQRLVRRIGDGLQQPEEMPGETRNALALEQVGGVAEAAQQLAVGAFAGIQHQVELGAAADAVQRLDFQPRQVEGFQAAYPVMVEQNLEQRVVAEAALRLQGLHQLLEWQVLVRLGVQHAVAGRRQQLVEGAVAVDQAAQHLGVDEEAHQALGLFLLAATDGQADAQVALAAVAIEQRAEGCQQQHEQRAALLQGQALQLIRQLRRHGEVQAVATKALLRRPRVIQGQFQQRVFAAQVLLPVGQLALALAALQPLALPDGEVGVLDRQGGQLGRCTIQQGAVAGGELVQQQLHRSTVGNDVVQAELQHLLVIGQVQQADAHQRAAGEVEGPGALRSHPLRQPRLALCRRQVVQAGFGECQGHALDHPLADLLAVVLEYRAQRRVTLLQLGEGTAQGLDHRAAAQAQATGDVVGGAVRCQFPEEPQALLVEGQRRALGVLQCAQGRRTGTRTTLLQRCRQVAQLRRVEQLAHRHFDAEALLQSRDHLDGHQRMTTQLEEMVQRADLRQAEHFGPDVRQQTLVVGGGSLVALAVHLPDRLRQLIAVQLAVGVARQYRQHQDARRHHVIRQLLAEDLAQLGAQALVIGGDVAHQLFAGEGFPCHHQGLAYARIGTQARFDLARFDTEATHLDLVIDTAEVVQGAVGPLAHQVAGAIQAAARRPEGVGDETFGSQARALEVTACQTVAAQVELATDAGGNGVQVAVEHPHAADTDAMADGCVGRLAAVFGTGLPDHRGDHGLGRAIAVDDPARAQHALDLFETGMGHGVAAEAVDPYRRHIIAAFGVLGDLLQIGRREGCHGHTVAAHGDVGLLRRPQAVVTQHQAGAVGERGQPAFVGAIEGEGHEVQLAVGRLHLVERTDGPAVHGQRAMGHRHALGQAGGAGGVDQVGQVARMRGDRRRLLRLAAEVQQVQVQALDTFGQGWAAKVAAIADQPGEARVAHLVGEAFLGVIQVQGHIGRAGLEYRQQGDHQLRRTRQADADATLRSHTRFAQVPGQLIRAPVQLGEAQ
ncbi:hypothetical protein D3C84_145550 [compost metagenome]